ncbi:hypothetical protein MYAM1_000096 [Malassezia yamatoensis]|uniref:Uncharacterized protein n=1 Tax=Malassezia yamatoensis TaxID=253288 RepID=A0AAJ5YRB9_9BASI|nr:hypothetical protein MYAM1_000096 [Malassezia yamatoensis]
MAISAFSAAPLVQTPIQLAVHSHLKEDSRQSNLCSTRICTKSRSLVALGNVVRLRSSGVRRRQGLVVHVEQGSTVVLMDVNTQTPIHTYTLAPSDHVCAPPLVVEGRQNGSLFRTTYLALTATRGTCLCVWNEQLDPSGRVIAAHQTEKRKFEYAGNIQALFVLRSGNLLAFESDAVMLLKNPLSDQDAGSELGKVHGAFHLRYDTHVLEAAKSPSGQDAILLLSGAKTNLEISLVEIHDTAPCLRTVSSVASASLSNDHEVTSAAFHPDGTLTILYSSGQLSTMQIEWDGELQMNDHRTTTLVSLRNVPAQVLLLSASHLLVMALPTGDKGKERAAALVWDVDLETVLAQVEWSLGTTPTNDSSISAVCASDAYVSILIDTPHSNLIRSSVLALPISVPTHGLLVHALHAAPQTDAWVHGVSKDHSNHDAKQALLPAPHKAFLSQMEQLAPAQRTSELDKHFSSFLQQESQRLRAAEQVKASRKAPKPALPLAFVQQVLMYALPAIEKGQQPTYAPHTLRYMLERQLLTTSLLPGNALATRIRATQDWSLMYLMLRHVPDLAESHAIITLSDALNQQENSTAPTVARVLQHVLAPPPFSKPVLRMALRTHISDNAHILILLDIVISWIRTVLHAPLTDDVKQEVGSSQGLRTIPTTSINYRTSDVRAPAIQAVVSFGEDLLDTFFPQLLTDSATHAALAEYTRALSQYTSELQIITKLQTPLATFQQTDKGKNNLKPDPKSKRLALHEASLLVPLYSRESLEI